MKKVVEKVSRFLSRENVDKYYDLKRELGAGNFSIVKLGVNRKTVRAEVTDTYFMRTLKSYSCFVTILITYLGRGSRH